MKLNRELIKNITKFKSIKFKIKYFINSSTYKYTISIKDIIGMRIKLTYIISNN